MPANETEPGHPILVLQMGKVASTAVVAALRDRYEDRRIYHIHSLRAADLEGAIESDRKIGREPPEHALESMEVIRTILEPRKPADVITMVRAPIERNISAFFEVESRKYNRLPRDERRFELSPEALLKKFRDDYYHTIPLTWFQRTVEPFLGIDVYASPFSPEQGWQVYEPSGPFRMLLMRTETDLEQKHEALRTYFDDQTIEVGRANVASKKWYADDYDAFRKLARFEPSFIDPILDAAYTRRFYSADEIESMRRKWTLPAVHSDDAPND